MRKQTSPRSIGVFIFEDCQIIDATGPAAVFGSANAILHARGGTPSYKITLVAPAAGRIETS